MKRIGLVGGRGYVGAELLSLLDRHPDFEIAYVGSSSHAGESVAHNNQIELRDDLAFQSLDVGVMRQAKIDAWVLAQGNGEALKWVEQLADSKTKFLDVSYDFRLDDQWVYGLPESNRTFIQRANQVSNPGCYATAVQLALLPILDWISGAPCAFGISGFSGAGKTPSDKNDPKHLADNILPYALTRHGHEKEISFQLKRRINFMPHVAQFFRGISITINVSLETACDRNSILNSYHDFFAAEPLVKIIDGIPEISEVRNTPYAMIGGFDVDQENKRLVIVSVIDNLLKGAASQAIQNLNLMFEFEETTGLID